MYLAFSINLNGWFCGPGSHMHICSFVLYSAWVHLIGVCAVLVLCAVWRIGESLVAGLVFTHIRFLPSVRAQMSLQVLQTRVRFITAFKLIRTNRNSVRLLSSSIKHRYDMSESVFTVHLWGFSPVCRRMWTTSMYWALKGRCSREQSIQWHTNSFFSPWMCSLLMCWTENQIKKHDNRQHIQKVVGASVILVLCMYNSIY